MTEFANPTIPESDPHLKVIAMAGTALTLVGGGVVQEVMASQPAVAHEITVTPGKSLWVYGKERHVPEPTLPVWTGKQAAHNGLTDPNLIIDGHKIDLVETGDEQYVERIHDVHDTEWAAAHLLAGMKGISVLEAVAEFRAENHKAHPDPRDYKVNDSRLWPETVNRMELADKYLSAVTLRAAHQVAAKQPDKPPKAKVNPLAKLPPHTRAMIKRIDTPAEVEEFEDYTEKALITNRQKAEVLIAAVEDQGAATVLKYIQGERIHWAQNVVETAESILYTTAVHLNEAKHPLDASKFSKPGLEIKAELLAKYGGVTGKLRPEDLVDLGGVWQGHKLNPAYADALRLLDADFYKTFGHHLEITDSYRDYDQQVDTRRRKGIWAAVPGHSLHGLGMALDFGSNINKFGSAEYHWMREHGPKYGIVNPGWAHDGKGIEEAWHWEYQGRPEGFALTAHGQPNKHAIAVLTEAKDRAQKEVHKANKLLHDAVIQTAHERKRDPAEVVHGFIEDLGENIRQKYQKALRHHHKRVEAFYKAAKAQQAKPTPKSAPRPAPKQAVNVEGITDTDGYPEKKN